VELVEVAMDLRGDFSDLVVDTLLPFLLFLSGIENIVNPLIILSHGG
jgi:hypothetical protein